MVGNCAHRHSGDLHFRFRVGGSSEPVPVTRAHLRKRDVGPHDAKNGDEYGCREGSDGIGERIKRVCVLHNAEHEEHKVEGAMQSNGRQEDLESTAVNRMRQSEKGKIRVLTLTVS